MMKSSSRRRRRIKVRYDTTVRCKDDHVALDAAGSGVEKPIGEAVLQIDMMLGKERKVNVRGETHLRSTHTHTVTDFSLKSDDQTFKASDWCFVFQLFNDSGLYFITEHKLVFACWCVQDLVWFLSHTLISPSHQSSRWTTWSGRRPACSGLSSTSPWSAPSSPTRNASSPQSPRTTAGRRSSTSLSSCECFFYFLLNM